MAGKLKLVELTDFVWEPRWEALKAAAKSEFEVDLEVEVRKADLENFPSEFEAVMRGDADVCRIADEFCVEVLKHLPRSTHKAQFSGACPTLLREKGVWWPRPLLDEALTRSLSRHVGQVDIGSSALVAGAGGLVKLVVASLVSLGFETVNITDQNDAAGGRLADEMSRKYFQTKFRYIPYQAITTLPGVHSIIVNTTKLNLENELLDELYFFNFLKSGGVVADLTLVPSDTPLLIEARQWGARHLAGDVVAAQTDALMLEKVLGRKLDVEKYRIELRKLIDAAPFDASPFLERFRERGM